MHARLRAWPARARRRGSATRERRLTAATRNAACRATCALDPRHARPAARSARGGRARIRRGRSAAAPRAAWAASSCTTPRWFGPTAVAAAVRPPGTLSMDATPMMHRLPAAAHGGGHPLPARLRFMMILREPAERAASHFGMLRKLALRGEAWAMLYVRNVTTPPDAHLLAEARARALRRGEAHRHHRRPPPKAWHECVAVACGFHACVVGQSIYEPQPRAWLNTFSAPQFFVLTLDEFSEQPSAALGRIASFLGVGAFPRLVTNWKWQWNVGKAQKKRSAIVAEATLSTLRRFFAPHTTALAGLLRKRGQAAAAATVDSWPRA